MTPCDCLSSICWLLCYRVKGILKHVWVWVFLPSLLTSPVCVCRFRLCHTVLLSSHWFPRRSVANKVKVEIILSTSARCQFRVARHAICSTLKLGATPHSQHILVLPLIMFRPLHDSVSRFIVSAAISHSDDFVCLLLSAFVSYSCHLYSPVMTIYTKSTEEDMILQIQWTVTPVYPSSAPGKSADSLNKLCSFIELLS